jgi:hypothetical protein
MQLFEEFLAFALEIEYKKPYESAELRVQRRNGSEMRLI